MALSYIEGPYLNVQSRDNMTDIFADFETRFNEYCIQSGFRDLSRDPITEQVQHYKEPLLEIAALKVYRFLQFDAPTLPLDYPTLPLGMIIVK